MQGKSPFKGAELPAAVNPVWEDPAQLRHSCSDESGWAPGLSTNWREAVLTQAVSDLVSQL